MTVAATETLRIQALERFRILDSKNDETVDALARLAADVCETPIALVSLVDSERQWFLAKVGLALDETPREISFCSHAIEQPDQLFVVECATDDERFKNNPLVTGEHGVRFYAGMPISSSEGFALGTICVIDTVARTLTDQQSRTLRALAMQAAALLEARRQINELKGRLDQRTHAHDGLQRVARLDPVSGALDRGSLMEVIESAYIRLQANPRMRAAVVLIGVEGTKAVDESLGHGVGDALMAACVGRVSASLRNSEKVARYGDKQIVLLLDDIESAPTATGIAKRLLELFEQPFQIGAHSLRVRANIGLTVTDGSHQRAADLVRDATTAMYHAKALGEGTLALFTPALHALAVNRLHLEGDLRRAIDAREFCLHFQPVMELANTTLVGFEALIRWQHPARGLVMPDKFIAIAEETGLIEPIGEWVLRESCRQLRTWQREHPDFGNLTVSVNVSAKQFRNARLHDIVAEALADADLDATCLRIEVTETALMEQREEAVETLARLRDLGVVAHLDDFGCGYSSLNYLRKFPVNTLKIDRSFISGSGRAVADADIVHAVIALARKLDLDVTAEGIETREQLEQLREFGCAHGQGYLLSRPLAPERIPAFLVAQRDKLQAAATLSDRTVKVA